mmetsp:Transcript_10538/g.18511  ORF Transcript_10538/g.18511 Transcript_10538/m.18511 type:complete len:163 (+) Transcript_10538:289-777(+)
MTERRVLVVHKDQLAVFDFSLPFSNETVVAGGGVTAYVPEALLLWTHKLSGTIIDRASLSGDGCGCAIDVALRGEGVGVPYPFDMRTFVRDGDDGTAAAAAVVDRLEGGNETPINQSPVGVAVTKGGWQTAHAPSHRIGNAIARRASPPPPASEDKEGQTKL